MRVYISVYTYVYISSVYAYKQFSHRYNTKTFLKNIFVLYRCEHCLYADTDDIYTYVYTEMYTRICIQDTDDTYTHVYAEMYAHISTHSTTYVYTEIYTRMCTYIHNKLRRCDCFYYMVSQTIYGVATISRLLKMISHFCKRAL